VKIWRVRPGIPVFGIAALVDSVSSPISIMTSDAINSTSAASGHYMYQPGSASVNGQNYTASIYLKGGTTNAQIIQLSLGTGAFGEDHNNRPYININTTNCTVTKSVNATFSTAIDAGIGWCRPSISAQDSASGYTVSPYPFFVNNDWNAVRYPIYVGNTTAMVYVWGAQTEIRDAATAYNATGSSAGSPPVANYTQSRTSAGYGAGVQFTDDSTNTPTSWYWEFGDGNTSTLQSPFFIYNKSGTYMSTTAQRTLAGPIGRIRLLQQQLTTGRIST